MSISSVNTNIAALYTQRQLTQNSISSADTNQQLASGSRINSAADDAAGLAISNKLNAQIRGMEQAVRNTNDGISMLQVAGGSLSQGTEIVQRMRELTLQAANGTLNDSDRNAIGKEYGQLLDQLESIQQGSSFNGRKLFTEEGNVSLQIGEGAGDVLGLSLKSFDVEALREAGSDPAARLDALDATLEDISAAQADIGAASNRLESTANTLSNNIQNTVEANSRIADTDYAKAISERSAQQIREQVQIAMMAQANAQPKQVLRLLNIGA